MDSEIAAAHPPPHRGAGLYTLKCCGGDSSKSCPSLLRSGVLLGDTRGAVGRIGNWSLLPSALSLSVGKIG